MIGEIVSLQLFDVGGTFNSLDLRAAYAGRIASSGPSVGKGTPSYVEFPQPVIAQWGRLPVESTIGIAAADVSLYYYKVGAVSVRFRLPFETERFSALQQWQHLRLLFEGERLTLEQAARRIVEAERKIWARHVADRHTEHLLYESYTVFCLRDARPVGIALVDAHRASIAGLLKGEDGHKLHEREVQEALKRTYAYYRDDVVVVDWDACLVADPSAEWEDLIFVLEIANLQLLEFRAYDDYLDDQIARSYDEMERLFRRPSLFGGVRRKAHELSLIRMEFSELADEVDNISKFLGDWWLARVFQAAGEKFHIADWRAAVDEKLASIHHLYELAKAESDTRRLLVLEVLIVLLFILDLGVILVQGWR